MNVTCPNCRKPLTARDELAGTKVKCPKCRRDFTAPDEGEEVTGKQAHLRFSCPHCDKALAVRPALAGHEVRCPGCRDVIETPAQAPDTGPTLAEDSAPEIRLHQGPGYRLFCFECCDFLPDDATDCPICGRPGE
jgi:phage FluMu protein Com